MKRFTVTVTVCAVLAVLSSCSPPAQSCQYTFEAAGQKVFSCAEASGLTADQTQAYRQRCDGSGTDGGTNLYAALGVQMKWQPEPCPRAQAYGACTVASSGGYKESVWYYAFDGGSPEMTEQMCKFLSGTWEAAQAN